MATAQNIIDNSLARQMDTSKTQWSDPELLALLNKGVDYLHQVLINNQIDWATTSTATTVSTVAATELYDLESDFLGMVEGDSAKGEGGVWLDKTTSYAFLAPCDQRESVKFTGADRGEPTQYYLTATQIGLLAVPDAVYALKYRYYTTPTTLLVSSTMPYSGLFNEALSSFMSSRALTRNGMMTSGEMAIYNELESQALAIARRRTPIPNRLKMRFK